MLLTFTERSIRSWFLLEFLTLIKLAPLYQNFYAKIILKAQETSLKNPENPSFIDLIGTVVFTDSLNNLFTVALKFFELGNFKCNIRNKEESVDNYEILEK